MAISWNYTINVLSLVFILSKIYRIVFEKVSVLFRFALIFIRNVHVLLVL